MQQERRATRLSLSFPVLVEYGGEIRRHRAADVSERGMLILSREPYPLGCELRVTFNLPGTDVELVAGAEVIHVNWDREEPGGAFRMGLAFQRFDEGELHPPLRVLPC